MVYPNFAEFFCFTVFTGNWLSNGSHQCYAQTTGTGPKWSFGSHS
jgi:hypothetical protein